MFQSIDSSAMNEHTWKQWTPPWPPLTDTVAATRGRHWGGAQEAEEAFIVLLWQEIIPLKKSGKAEREWSSAVGQEAGWSLRVEEEMCSSSASVLWL